MMNIKIDATGQSPKIDFDFSSNVFSIQGESYMEDVTTFYGEPIQRLRTHLSSMDGGAVEFNFELVYCNSSSVKVLLELFDSLEESAKRGVSVTANWHYKDNDDRIEELGEDFADDLEAVTFNMKTIES